MATASFDRSFVVNDQESIKKIHDDLAQPKLIKVKVRNYKADSKKGIQLLKQRLSNLENC